MSEERFDRLEQSIAELGERTDRRFDVVDQRLDRLETDVAGLKTDVATLKTDVATLKTDVATLKTDVGELKTDVAGLKIETRSLSNRIDTLDRHMHVLYEDLKSDIAALPRYSGPTQAEFAELRDMMAHRLDPLEIVVRQHSTDIGELKRQRL